MMASAHSARRGEAYERLLRQERLILDVTELLAGALDDIGVTRAELARRMDRTPGFVSQVLGGGRNLTLRTIADIAAALSLRPSFELSRDRTSVLRWTEETCQWVPRMPLVADHGAGPPSQSVGRPELPVAAAA